MAPNFKYGCRPGFVESQALVLSSRLRRDTERENALVRQILQTQDKLNSWNLVPSQKKQQTVSWYAARALSKGQPINVILVLDDVYHT